MKRPWVAFFSQTGSEISNLIDEFDELEVVPDVICTNNSNWRLSAIGMRFWLRERVVYEPKWNSGTYARVLEPLGATVLATLHGWLRIVPPDICEEFEIYNGHPALADTYPDLKGKDQQEQIINNVEQYPTIGSIIHRCTAELDSGEVVERVEIPNFKVHNRNLMYDVLKDTSLQTWLNFLPSKLEL